METQTNLKNKLNSRGKKAIHDFKDLGALEEDFEVTAKKAMKSERAMAKSVIGEASEISKYLKTHWKKVLPVVAIATVGALIFKKKSLRN